jgi:hypothetical protein
LLDKDMCELGGLIEKLRIAPNCLIRQNEKRPIALRMPCEQMIIQVIGHKQSPSALLRGFATLVSARKGPRSSLKVLVFAIAV